EFRTRNATRESRLFSSSTSISGTARITGPREKLPSSCCKTTKRSALPRSILTCGVRFRDTTTSRYGAPSVVGSREFFERRARELAIDEVSSLPCEQPADCAAGHCSPVSGDLRYARRGDHIPLSFGIDHRRVGGRAGFPGTLLWLDRGNFAA